MQGEHTKIAQIVWFYHCARSATAVYASFMRRGKKKKYIHSSEHNVISGSKVRIIGLGVNDSFLRLASKNND